MKFVHESNLEQFNFIQVGHQMQLLIPREVWLKLLRFRNLRANANNATFAGGKQRTRAISQFAKQ